jgi:hypothetical protein
MVTGTEPLQLAVVEAFCNRLWSESICGWQGPSTLSSDELDGPYSHFTTTDITAQLATDLHIFVGTDVFAVSGDAFRPAVKLPYVG